MERKISDKERRTDLRVGMSEPLMIRFQIKKQKAILSLPSKKFTGATNLSTGGICLELPMLDQKQIDKIIEGRDKLFLEFDIPHLKKPLRVTGKITWLEKKDKRGKTIYLTGISFEGLEEKDREKILLQLISLCLKGRASV